ncbi:MAG: hypothetical protein AB7P21_25915 [Lautropia sp.]
MSAAPGLHEPFDTLGRQREAAAFGLWIFIASEILFFGALLLGYIVYRFLYPGGFEAAGREASLVHGTVNTLVLLTSSATMAVAAWAGHTATEPEDARDARAHRHACRAARRHVVVALGATALLGLAFLAVKGVEYRDDLARHLLPFDDAFPLDATGARIFFSFYWLLTAIHALHLSIGIGAVLYALAGVVRERPGWARTATLHVLGLYWHLVDLVWIFLFPLFYLLGRGGA